ncbi:MAG: SDR family oxidoreductase [Candidatus Cloacimonetes bacterium]|nr:SDR family oxidoreductase [Candidatus Cloacimonadota bacterium]MCF7813330.1 SDR family oxidoreductase [Candidatus Cloacimonadota bacterium]MCF7867819.1 SDR family oxidoreductase [Candidatus Cloacimonadota bacterium]MCF7883295.1 SDR family oxidoreductase [Candidatus Cloacimonadota bacterium]
MKTLVVGASGATGKQLVEQLLNMGQKVKAIVRNSANIPDDWQNNDNITIIIASISELSRDKLQKLLVDCDSVASCLGHNLTFKGMFGNPRKLVTDSVRLLCEAIKTGSPQKPVKFALMNTTAVRNKDLAEPVSLVQKIVLGLIHLFLPPHSDNEAAADYLRLKIGQKNNFIEWVAIRPDTLINEDVITDYQIYRSPIRSALFNPGRTSRINVGNFMARLLMEPDLWKKWQGQMPVIYNKED